MKINSPYFYAKIVENKYVDNITKDGQIYMNLLSYFRELESSKNDIGDSHEAQLTNNVSFYLDFGNGFTPIHNKNTNHKIVFNSNQCIFSTFAIKNNMFKKISDSQFIAQIDYDTIERLCKDKGGINNCSILVFDGSIIKKIITKLKSKGLFANCNLVKYDDFNYEISDNPLFFKDQTIESCFHKEKKYNYQNEFRIVAINKVKKEISDLHIEVSRNDFKIFQVVENKSVYFDVLKTDTDNYIYRIRYE